MSQPVRQCPISLNCRAATVDIHAFTTPLPSGVNAYQSLRVATSPNRPIHMVVLPTVLSRYSGTGTLDQASGSESGDRTLGNQLTRVYWAWEPGRTQTITGGIHRQTRIIIPSSWLGPLPFAMVGLYGDLSYLLPAWNFVIPTEIVDRLH